MTGLIQAFAFMKKMTWKETCICIALITGFLAFCNYIEVGISQTRSLPYDYFITVKGLQVQRGLLVRISGHSTVYHPSPLPYVKRLIGLPGDAINIANDTMYVAGHKVGLLRSQSTDGRKLTPLQAKTIPQGYVFVAATAPDSFDSRYEEFGLVKIERITGRSFAYSP